MILACASVSHGTKAKTYNYINICLESHFLRPAYNYLGVQSPPFFVN